MPHSLARPNDQPSASLPAGKRILVIDDDEAVRKSLAAILTARGYLAAEAESGPVALAALREPAETIDAVILDLNMPGMNGHEVLAALRVFCPELPVVIASGHDLEGAADLSDSRLRFVQKALGPRALLAKLGELLQPAS
jgi:CheY-like chemotaxis protein